MPGLSKSRLTAFRQCAKRLWLEVNKPELRVYSAKNYHLFDVGHQIGEIARREYPDGVLIESQDDLDRAVEETAAAMTERRPIFEATFRHEQLLIRADLLLPTADGWHMAEVKSTVSAKEKHLPDVAAQVWTMRGCGVPVTRASVRHIDSSFALTRQGDFKGLLTDTDVLDDIGDLLTSLPQTVADALATIEGAEPVVSTGDHCFDPHDCPFFAHCRGSEPAGPAYPVTLLPGRAGNKVAMQLAADGYDDLEFVPLEKVTHLTLKRMHAATASGIPYWDASAARAEISAWAWPHHYLDFETVGPAVPVWVGAHPYAAAAFQFSLHTLHADGSLTHSGFLDLSGDDPSRACADALLAQLGAEGSIVSYSAFERTTIRGLATRVPEIASQLKALESRIVDLLSVVRDYHYHRDQRGSYSIKSVQPVLAPHLDYEALGEVQDGMSAQMAYLEAVSPACTPERRADLKGKLEAYCALDTLAMVEVVRALVGD